MVLVVAGVAGYGYWKYQSVERLDLDLVDAVGSEPRNFLIIGSDSRSEIEGTDPSAGVMLGSEAPAGRRSDSIAILRVDPGSDRMDVLSIPRDLWVTGVDGEKHRINESFSGSTQDLIDTIDANLDIPINHYVEVDFVGFRELVDSLGGVPMYFDSPVRDLNSGLRVENPGCVVLNGEAGLAFARSRNLEWSDGSTWHTDGSGDLGRINRQQLLMRASLRQVRSLGLDDVGTLTGLIDAGLNATTIDSELGIGDLTSFGKRLADFDPQHLQSHSIAVSPYRTSGGAAVLVVDEEASADTLAMFRGEAAPAAVTTTTTPPPATKDIQVDILNAGAADGEARRVSYVFVDGDFVLGAVETAGEQLTGSTVSHAPGAQRMGELVAGWLGPAPEVVEDETLTAGTVVVRLGSEFEQAFSPDTSAEAEESESAASVPTDSTGSTATPTTAPTTTTTVPGWTPGVAPEGVDC